MAAPVKYWGRKALKSHFARPIFSPGLFMVPLDGIRERRNTRKSSVQ